MNKNDEKAKEILNTNDIPEEISPENIKKMLDEKAPAKKRPSRISMTGRVIAALAACSVIVGGAVGTSGLLNRGSRDLPEYSQTLPSLTHKDEKEPDGSVELPQAKGPYMSGADSYEQIYELYKSSVENSKYAYRNDKYFMTDDMAIAEVEEAAPAAVNGSADKEFDGAAGDESFVGGMGGGGDTDPEYIIAPADEDDPKEGPSEDVTEEPSEEAPTEEETETPTDSPTEEETEAPSEDETEAPTEEDTEAPTEDEGDPEHSDTYSQEKDVLEADIVKTDGKRIFHAANDVDPETGDNTPYLDVAAVKDGVFGDPVRIDINVDYDLEGDGWIENTYVRDMYLYNDMIIVIGTKDCYRNSWTIYEDYDDEEYGTYIWEDSDAVFVSFYTADDTPELLGTYWQDGGYDDVRISPDGYMYLTSVYLTRSFEQIDDSTCISSYIPSCGIDKMECLEPCDILLPGDDLDIYDKFGYTVIGSIDLTEPQTFTPCDSKALAGLSGTIYCTADNLYVAVPGDKTDITRISVSGGSISPEAVGSVEGYVKDQFSMSEYNGYFRVATTVDEWKSNGSFLREILDLDVDYEHVRENNVYVLDMDMNIVGSVEGFGKDETVRSVNFSGDMGYVVTYEQTDPLFAIDLRDPEKPFITDEFKILGYSTYMQKWDEGHLLGFGADADENGIETGIKIVMFDNSDPYDLKEAGLFAVHNGENGYVYSIAKNERKALLIAPEKNLIGIPLAVTNWDNNEYHGEYKYMFFSYDDGEFVLKGEISVPDEWDKYGSCLLERALYIGDYVYAVSAKRMISADMDTLETVDEVFFN